MPKFVVTLTTTASVDIFVEAPDHAAARRAAEAAPIPAGGVVVDRKGWEVTSVEDFARQGPAGGLHHA